MRVLALVYTIEYEYLTTSPSKPPPARRLDLFNVWIVSARYYWECEILYRSFTHILLWNIFLHRRSGSLNLIETADVVKVVSAATEVKVYETGRNFYSITTRSNAFQQISILL